MAELSIVAYFHRLGTTGQEPSNFNDRYWKQHALTGPMNPEDVEFFYFPLIETIRRHVPVNGRRRPHLLEVGCGAGELMSYLGDNGYEVTGLDSSDVPVAVARQRGLSAHRSSGPRIDLVPEIQGMRFRGVYMHRVLEEPVMSQYGAGVLLRSALRLGGREGPVIVGTTRSAGFCESALKSMDWRVVSDDPYDYSYVNRVVVVKSVISR